MKKIVGFLLITSIAANSYALTETMQKVYQGVQDLKTNLQNAAGAFSAGNTTEAAEHLNKAVIGVREAAADIMSTKNAIKDVAPKVEATKENLKTMIDDTTKAHESAQKAQEALKSALASHAKNDSQTAQKHDETAYDLLIELVPNLKSLEERLTEQHQKAEKLSDVVQPKSTFAKPFGGWFE